MMSVAAKDRTKASEALPQPARVLLLERTYIFLEAYLLLVLIDLGMHRLGLDRICAIINRRAVDSKAPASETAGEIARIALGAYRWYRPRVACLHRALTLYWVLRRRRIQAALCLGVRTHPFAAHSWVEHQGEVLGDSKGFTDRFQVIKRIF
jgi:hypothetical protein